MKKQGVIPTKPVKKPIQVDSMEIPPQRPSGTSTTTTSGSTSTTEGTNSGKKK